MRYRWVIATITSPGSDDAHHGFILSAAASAPSRPWSVGVWPRARSRSPEDGRVKGTPAGGASMCRACYFLVELSQCTLSSRNMCCRLVDGRPRQNSPISCVAWDMGLSRPLYSSSLVYGVSKNTAHYHQAGTNELSLRRRPKPRQPIVLSRPAAMREINGIVRRSIQSEKKGETERVISGGPPTL